MKSFKELYKHNFGKELKKKPTFYKDKDGKMQKTSEDKWLSYVEWATVLVALYNIGEAKGVTYSSDMHPTKKNTLKICLNIDGVDYFSDYPIIDGNSIISDPNQMQIHKAELRGFVKCVAIHTGLGLSLWQKEESHLNELVPTEPKKERFEHEDNTVLFMEWSDTLQQCKTKDELGSLYTKNKTTIDGSKTILALFTKRKTEIEASK